MIHGEFTYRGQRPCGYLPSKRSANGGKVSRSDSLKGTKAIALTFAMLIIFERHLFASMSHAISQAGMAAVVTPEGGPVGRENVSTRAAAVELSPVTARIPKTKLLFPRTGSPRP